MPQDVPTSRGTILNSLYRFIRRELSEEQLARFHERLTPDDATILSGTVHALQRVPEKTLNRMTEIAASELGEDLVQFGRRAGRAELEDAVRVYRFLLAVLTPNVILSRASTLWSTIHNTGRLVVADKSRIAARVRLEEFDSELSHCARLWGWIEGLAEMSRVKNPHTAHDVCLVRGEGDCEWIVAWEV